MRLFWKLFFTLTITLLITATLSTWLARHWMQRDQAIEQRLEQLASHAETAGNMLAQEGVRAYRRWLMHATRTQHFRGMLVDSAGHNLLQRPIPEPMRPLIQQVIHSQRRVTRVQPPTLAVALPVGSAKPRRYWVAMAMIPHQVIQQTGQQLMAIRIISALAIMLLISWLLTRMFTRPIDALQQAAERLGRGALETRTPAALSARSDELGDMARSFDAMAAQLDGLVSSHKQLLRDLSHELRSPLARLQVALELARNAAGEQAQAELNRIGKEAEQLNALIGEVLTLARFDQGSVERKSAQLQLDAMLAEIIEDAAFEAQVADKRVVCHAMAPCRVAGDPIWLRRAFDNIIRNAIRHTADGTAVEVTLAPSHDLATVTIRDHGTGVAPEALPWLFEPFYRASTAREREPDGSGYGLGLTIAQRAIALHGGSIDAANHPDGGLAVRVTIPRLT